MSNRFAYLALVAFFTIPMVLADDSTSTASLAHAVAVPSLLGAWSGHFKMLTPQGFSSGETQYEFTEQDGELLKGVNRWRTLKTAAGSNGDEPLPNGVNAVFGVISADGFVYVVSDNDTAIRRMHLSDENTLDFAEFAGGEQRHVVSGKLSRSVQE